MLNNWYPKTTIMIYAYHFMILLSCFGVQTTNNNISLSIIITYHNVLFSDNIMYKSRKFGGDTLIHTDDDFGVFNPA